MLPLRQMLYVFLDIDLTERGVAFSGLFRPFAKDLRPSVSRDPTPSAGRGNPLPLPLPSHVLCDASGYEPPPTNNTSPPLPPISKQPRDTINTTHPQLETIPIVVIPRTDPPRLEPHPPTSQPNFASHRCGSVALALLLLHGPALPPIPTPPAVHRLPAFTVTLCVAILRCLSIGPHLSCSTQGEIIRVCTARWQTAAANCWRPHITSPDIGAMAGNHLCTLTRTTPANSLLKRK